MKVKPSSSILLHLFLSTLALASAARKISLLCIHSGTQYHYLSVITKGDHLTVGSSQNSFVILNDDGSIPNSDGTKFLSLNADHQYTFGSKKDTGFSIQNGYLTNSNSFYACPGPDNTVFLASECSTNGGATVFLKVMDASTPTGFSTVVRSPTPTPKKPATAPAAPAAQSPSEAKTYNVKVACNGCSLDKSSILKSDAHPHVFSVGGSDGSNVQFKILSDGTITEGSGRGVFVNSVTGEIGFVSPWGDQKASSGFSTKDGKLVYKDPSSFKSCPSGPDARSLSFKDCTGGTQIEVALSL